MIPFRVDYEPGVPVYEQVLFAAKKAMMAGKLRSGDRFPSVRALSVGLKINPNTAHKVVAQLTAEGLLEVHPGIGTVVSAPRPSSRADRAHLLGRDVEQLVVEAKKLGLTLDDVCDAVEQQWRRLESGREHKW